MKFIDLEKQLSLIKDKIDLGINNIFAHGKYILGPEVAELEDKLSSYTGAQYCISCANGTDALQISLMSLGVGAGDEVLHQISMVGDDLKLDPGVGVCGKDGQSVPVGVGQPSLKIDMLTVGGTQL